MKARPPKISDRDTATLTNSAINTEVKRLNKASSDVTDAMIKAGYGDLKPSEMYADPLLQDVPVISWYIKINGRLQNLHWEKEQRMGSRWPGELPRGKARIPLATHERLVKGNPMAKKTKRKATPAQLRALKKAHAALKKKRALKKKAPKRPRRNPAYANYSKARSVARGNTRGVNPVRKLSPVYVIGRQKFRGVATEYWDGVFWGVRNNAAQWTALTVVKRIANSVANATGRPVSIFDIRK